MPRRTAPIPAVRDDTMEPAAFDPKSDLRQDAQQISNMPKADSGYSASARRMKSARSATAIFGKIQIS